MESKIVTAVGISVNGLHLLHARRIRHAMEYEVLKHHIEHGDITDDHAFSLKAKIDAAHQRELDAIASGQ